MRLLNRGLIAALIINLGGYYAGGTYEVIWSLFLEGLGANLQLIGLTFAMFGLPVLVLSPFAGRLVDRRGSLAFIVVGSILPAVTGILYTFLVDPVLAVPLILLEATGFAFLNPALYAVVAASSPPGRSSTTQGLFGAAGTLGFIVASLMAGILAEQNILYPFYVFSALMTLTSRARPRDRRVAPDRQTADRGAGAPGRDRLTDRPLCLSSAGGVEQRQLVGLITRRSLVRIQSPQPTPFSEPRVPTNPGFFLCPRWLSSGQPHSQRNSRAARSNATAQR